MEILRLSGDTVYLLFHASEAAEVGEQFQIIERSENPKGIVVQIISNDSHEYPGIVQELIQTMLERQLSTTHRIIDREAGLREIRNLKIAKAKIRKKIENGEWSPWDGWIPTRNVDMSQVTPEELCAKIIPTPKFPLQFLTYRNQAISIDGPRLDKVNVVTGVKGSGKSHLAKHLVISLSSMGVPCIVFDINGEYSTLPNSLTLRWGETFLPDLAQLGYWILLQIVQMLNPLPETSRNEFEHNLARFFNARRDYCKERRIPFTIGIDYLLTRTWSGNDLVQGAILRRLELIQNLNLFSTNGQQVEEGILTSFDEIYEFACDQRPVIIDFKNQSIQMQKTLSMAIISQLERICDEEASESGQGRYPFVFFEEAHFYIEEPDILNLITRGRHIGMASVFITNTPEKLPDTVFRQLDNLYLQSLSHKGDIRKVSENSFTDEETIESFATRMLPRHALVIGKVTDRYPIIFKVDPLPPNVPPSGVTRTTWTRLNSSAS
jgi:hypothetical protein